eukprot:CAMPEP_0174820582 /NCGR_PEP_ID=MMETSP1107-20130205/4496_1 /TAXON_ID=36770 /ORGANISM="Paraphysomonas vestita, Strain GFlagA" /LENGTH=187 /DNA_ID=CAMNT_0016036205 /DNA_START=2042 /DNA_END=2605 /DNA_ORIENTATION=+
MLLRFAKHSVGARNWLRINREKLKWIDAWLNARRSGSYLSGSVLTKPRKTNGYGAGNAIPSQVGANNSALAANLFVAWKHLMNSNYQPNNNNSNNNNNEDNNNNNNGGILNGIDYGGYWNGAGYDSDDDPTILIGKRVKVRWSDQDYAGTITQYHDDTGQHTVSYDTGDVKASNLSTKVWSVLENNK